MEMIKIGLKCWKCEINGFFPHWPPLKEYVLYTQLNIDNYGAGFYLFTLSHIKWLDWTYYGMGKGLVWIIYFPIKKIADET